MKKTVLALALLGASAGAAQAQSPTIVYGLIDLSVSTVSSGAAKNARTLQMNPGGGNQSIFGFRGAEDLGDGMAAIFGLQMALQPDTGGGGNAAALSGTNAPVSSLFNRQSYVGLQSKLGTIKLGRDFTPAVLATLPAVAIVSGMNTGMATSTTAQGISNDYFNSNQISYESPNFSGFSFKGNYVFGEVAGASSKGSSLGGALAYKNGPINLAAGGQRDNDLTGHSIDWYVVTGAYSLFDTFKITAGFDQVHNTSPVVSASPAVWHDSTMATIGASYYLKPQLAFAAQYFRVKDTVTGTASRQTVLNVDYALSKRTSLYVLASLVQNGAVPISPIYSGAASVPNANGKGLALGIQHKF